LSSYGEAIHLDPDDAQIWRSKAKCLERLKRPLETLASYNEALRLDPDNPYFYKEKGDIHLSLESLEDALTSYEKAIHLFPEFAQAYLQKSVVLKMLAEQAYQTFERLKVRVYKKTRKLDNNE